MESSDAIQLQSRDYAFLLGLFECRIMAARHIASLYFDNKQEYAKKRLQKLKAAGYVGERRRRVNEPSVLYLTKKGFEVLDHSGLLLVYPRLSIPSFERRARVSEIRVRHELEVMDVKEAFHTAARPAKMFTIAKFSTWPALHQFTVSRPHRGSDEPVQPDGFIQIHEMETNDGLSEHTFYLEVDRSTEAQGILANRAACYLEHYTSGGFAVAHGAPRSAFKEFPFRVLIVLSSAARRNNTANALLRLNPPIFTHAWLSTFSEATYDPFGPIWMRPTDYRTAVAGTSFDTDQPRHGVKYGRELERDRIVEKSVTKRRLIG